MGLNSDLMDYVGIETRYGRELPFVCLEHAAEKYGYSIYYVEENMHSIRKTRKEAEKFIKEAVDPENWQRYQKMLSRTRRQGQPPGE